MTPMNNRVAQLMQRINYLRQTSAQARQMEQSLRGKSPQELEQFVRNMCKERGITPEDFARSMGIQIPSSR